MSPLVEEALRSLTLRMGRHGPRLSTDDRAAVMQLLHMVQGAGECVDPAEITLWARRSNVWTAAATRTLGEIAKKVACGVQPPQKLQWRDDMLDLLRSRLAVT